ncbi:MAG: PEP-CTERM sorting domain-containing protein [Phycisphaeraceae bacterium]
MKLYRCAIVAALAAMPLSAAFAAPVVDGSFDAAEYQTVIPDGSDGSAQFVGTGLDITHVGFSLTGGTFYVGLQTADTFDVNGDDTALPRHRYTGFWIDFTNGSDHYLLDTATTGSAALAYADLYYSPDGINYNLVPGFASVSAIGTGLELSFDASFASAISFVTSGFEFAGQLDGSGAWADDQVDGIAILVPEPATLALFAAGTALMVARKRKHA